MLTHDRGNPATILEEWRSVERRLADCTEGSADYDELAARVLELAGAYRDASRQPGTAATSVSYRTGAPADEFRAD